MLPALNFRRVLILLLVLGCISSACSSEADMNMDVHEVSQSDISFQEYLWDQHSLDLLIQMAILLAGAFGVAGLLPAPDEE